MAFNVLGKILTPEKQEEKKLEAQLSLTEQEVAFILTKLKTATYTGAEFEMFYLVWTKLAQSKPK